MIGDYKIILRDIIELFYQPPFKIFNVNSVDGETLVRPFGYFISLGITTSLDFLKNLRDIISRSDYGFEAKLVELKSIKSDEFGDYLNMITSKSESEISKYPSEIKGEVLGEQEVNELLQSINSKIDSGDYSLTPLKQKLSDITKKIDNWDEYGVQMKDGLPGIYHKYVNYRKNENSELRIGIYVTKN